MDGGGESASWAREEIAGLTAIPDYGSEAWLGLEPSDPRRQAGLVLAAERWRESQGEGR